MHGNPHGGGGGNPHADFGARGNFGRGGEMRAYQGGGGAVRQQRAEGMSSPHQGSERTYGFHERGRGHWNNAENGPGSDFANGSALGGRFLRNEEHAHRYQNWRNYGSSGEAANRNIQQGRGYNGRYNGNVRGHGLAGITPRNFEAPRSFRAGAYQRPRGWYWHRWSYGEHLPRIFFASEYWIPDYVAFDLDAPPYGFVWVRYGDDALLVNRYTGEIVEVEYGLFA